ncbi:MAG TPA: excinuclease ABC subunit UvrA [Steroidobacteraceae bacterium]|nr:excinuclease ABC subunit UvrA [Steroidobacteraceae bacterium]
MSKSPPLHQAIRIQGARQNNLRNLSIDLPLGELTVITGVSGSGKSSLAFDTLYAEGQRRYVETFSPYARQFLDRMDRPQVDRIDGIPPAIAIDQTNPVRTSRSTVGTMTEINDHLKLLFARAAKLHCRSCGQPVRRDTPSSILASLRERAAAIDDPRLLVCFEVTRPENLSEKDLRALLESQGYVRFLEEDGKGPHHRLTVIQDRLRLGNAEPARVGEALEAALKGGRGHIVVHALDADGATSASWRYSAGLHCADCDISYQDPLPSHFSFNSPLGACDTCRGFGRVIGVDYDLVVPDQNKTLSGGAVKPWQTATGKECQDDMEKHAPAAGIPLDVPYHDLTDDQRNWVINGDGRKGRKHWYGIKGYFDWLESKAYKMHVRVLLSRYRSYTECPACKGARLKPESLLWRLGPHNMQALSMLPVARCREFFADLQLPPPLQDADSLVLDEIRARLGYLCEVGLGYLTLDRQSRTLSGGEVQRINLTTALGTSLVHTLFVLDEPSIGLHPRDMGRVIGVMQKLRDAGNTLVVVEHDPQIMFEADRLIDMGPGAGEHGGRILFNGPPAGVLREKESLTGDYLAGRRRIVPVDESPAVSTEPMAHAARTLVLEGASLHNVHDATLRVPLGQLVCVTGVSGSGKSTLVTELLYPALQRTFGKPAEMQGSFEKLSGHGHLQGVTLVDQSPIGRNARSCPVSFIGAFDPIRQLFAKLPEAMARGYTPGTFSFNSGNGRCPDCGGNGFEHVEMQLLADVYLRCPTCNGRRYRDEVLELTVEGAQGGRADIATVLEMTVTEALAFFAGEDEVLARLQPLADVGLSYLKLGQPVPTLSGGEAQRLKLAGHLADVAGTTGQLLIFDEPTTGLHFEDIARLMRAFRALTRRGASLLVIEHNLDVIGAADWLIELGPEGGDGGGRIVGSGTPAEFRAGRIGHTGVALASYTLSAEAVRDAARQHLAPPEPPRAIEVRGAREHNLKNIDAQLPHGAMTVVTGVSGSGKSTLAFDIIFGEGQRRYLESLNAYARQFVQPASRADADSVTGIPPAVAIEQRTSRGGRKSTVATLTEIHPFLRLLFVKLGVQHCPDCQIPIEPLSADAITARILKGHRQKEITLLAPLVSGRKGIYNELARWAAKKGHEQLRVDGKLVSTARWPKLARNKVHDIELPLGTLQATPRNETQLRELIDAGLEAGKGVVMVQAAGSSTLHSFSSRRACPDCGRGFPEPDPRLFAWSSARGWCPDCHGTGLELPEFDEEQTGEEDYWLEAGADAHVCETCDGARMNTVALAVKFRDRSIADLAALSIDSLATFLQQLKLGAREGAIAKDLVPEISGRLGFLARVGLGYLTLDRAAPTLSGGETQRLRLAAQLGSNLRGVCYVLDEPTIGLHPRDNRLLLDALGELGQGRNTLVVVEHDEETIRRADHVLDLGPGAGSRGGHVVVAGTMAEILAHPDSITGRCLREPMRHPVEPRRPVVKRGASATPMLRLEGISLHNLRGLDVDLPLGRLIALTGVSGSGKSTLALDVLRPELARALVRGTKAKSARPQYCKAIHGVQLIERVLEVDQTPIGKTPRSCPATYVGFWDAIRRVFAGTTEASIRGYGPSRFSFNTAGGRCPACEGQGMRTVEMNFLPDVKVPCDACKGKRFDPDTLGVLWRGRSIGDVLAMSVDEAVEFFASHKSIRHALALLQEVGLGYLTLGQQSPTLSGGEAQRIKLVTELARLRPDAVPSARGAFYILDEPTVGLHMADVERLIAVLHRLADAGNTVLVVEHNLDVVAQADWVIDLGPEAGPAGGRCVVAGPPSVVAGHRTSRTGAELRLFLEQRRAA